MLSVFQRVCVKFSVIIRKIEKINVESDDVANDDLLEFIRPILLFLWHLSGLSPQKNFDLHDAKSKYETINIIETKPYT